MQRTQTMLGQAIAVISAFVLIAATSATLHAQAFADLKSSFVDYSKADLAPRKA